MIDAPGDASRVATPSMRPRAARRHASYRRVRGGTATTMLTVYLVLLFTFPSNLQLAAVGSVGKPAVVWGAVLLVWWALSQVQPSARPARAPGRAVMVFLLLLVIVVLISFASALLRGQPQDQVGSAASSLVRIASWAGVLLVAADGIRTRDDIVTLFRRLSLSGGLLAALGMTQVLTGNRLLDWTGSIPGWEIDWSVMDSRGGTVRAVGTSTHPLEFSSTMTALLPVAIAYAVLALHLKRPQAWRWCLPPALIFLLLSITVTRSATIGLAVVLIVLIPFLPRTARRNLLGLLAVGALAVAVAFPRIVSTLFAAFTDVAEDPSALSRANALARVPEFTANSPIIGAGWGTFLPRYYIFDNAWVLMLVEVGALGVAMFALMMLSGVVNGLRAAWIAPTADGRLIGAAIAAPLTAITIQMALFDGLAFGQFVGTAFLLLGLSAGVGAVTDWGPPDRRAHLALETPGDVALPLPRSTVSAAREVGVDFTATESPPVAQDRNWRRSRPTA